MHTTNLREDVDGLVARASEAVGEDVAGVAVLGPVVVETAGVVLSAGGGVGALVQTGGCDGHVRTRYHRVVVMGHICECRGGSTG